MEEDVFEDLGVWGIERLRDRETERQREVFQKGLHDKLLTK